MIFSKVIRVLPLHFPQKRTSKKRLPNLRPRQRGTLTITIMSTELERDYHRTGVMQRRRPHIKEEEVVRWQSVPTYLLLDHAASLCQFCVFLGSQVPEISVHHRQSGCSIPLEDNSHLSIYLSMTVKTKIINLIIITFKRASPSHLLSKCMSTRCCEY
jgi:hypothetical protein